MVWIQRSSWKDRWVELRTEGLLKPLNLDVVSAWAGLWLESERCVEVGRQGLRMGGAGQAFLGVARARGAFERLTFVPGSMLPKAVSGDQGLSSASASHLWNWKGQIPLL